MTADAVNVGETVLQMVCRRYLRSGLCFVKKAALLVLGVTIIDTILSSMQEVKKKLGPDCPPFNPEIAKALTV